MRNYFNFPRWDARISLLIRDKRPIFRWLFKEEMTGWCGDVEKWIDDGVIKRINRVYLYDRNTLFDHIDWGGLATFPCPSRVQLLPVSHYIEFSNYDSLSEDLIERIEDFIRDSWDDSQPTYYDISDLDGIPIVPYSEFSCATSRHVELEGENFTLADKEPEDEEVTIGDVIENLIRDYSESPLC